MEAPLPSPDRDREQAKRDLRLAALLEGRPFPSAKSVAATLGISPTAAFRLLSRLKRTGVLRMISLPRLRDDACECVAYLGTDLMDTAAYAALVDRIRLDPAVASAALLSGRHELRLEAVHADVRTANAWFRDLMSHPGVTGGRLCFTRTVFRRWTHAAAMLGDTQAHVVPLRRET